MALSVGDRAPAFSLPCTGGETVSPESLRGRPAVLYFYPKDDLVGVSGDSLRSHDAFRLKHGIQFPLASDEGRTALEAFGVWVEKSMYGRKYMGTERTTVLLDRDGTVARIWPKVKVPGHAREVLDAAMKL